MSAVAVPAQPCKSEGVHNLNLSDATSYHPHWNPLFTVQSSENTKCCKPHNSFSSDRCKWESHLLRNAWWKQLKQCLAFQNPGPKLKHGLWWHTPLPRANSMSSIKMSPHIIWDKVEPVSNSKESCRAKQHYNWMNGTLVMIFISCLKGWRICSW